MIKKFSFWMVIVLVGSIGSMVFIHWNTIRELQQRTTHIQPLYQRQKTVDLLTLNLERYRRMSGNFRKLSSAEIAEVKSRLKSTATESVTRLDQLDPSLEERAQAHKLIDQVSELLRASAQIEPMLFSQDAYHKPEIQELHDEILSTLSHLGKSTQSRIESLRFDSTRSQTESVGLLLGVGAVILVFVFCMLLRNHLVYVRPLRRLHACAKDLGQGKLVSSPPHFTGLYSDIQSVMNQLAHAVEMHVRDRHKFIMDIVADLKGPLSMLQAGRYLLGDGGHQVNEEQQALAAESVKRGLAIFSGSLDNLNDIVDINRLENRLEEKTVDLCDLIIDSARSIVGANFGKKITVSVPPIPVWVSIDVQRFGRVFVQVLSKVLGTLSQESNIAVKVSQSMQGNYRGVEIQIQDAERFKNGRAAAAGPEQDVLKHWISENGLSMTLVHKIIKAHGGTITAAGVAGTSVSITIRLPQDRIVSRGLISPPTEDSSTELRGLLVSNPNPVKRDWNTGGPPR